MSALFDAAVLGPLRHSPGRTALVVLAIALGVALGFAIYLINRSAADEISLAARSLYGLADLAIEGAEGFDESLYPRIAKVPGVAVASPVVEVEARLVGTRGTLTLIGLDGFRSRQLQPSFAASAASMAAETFTAFDPGAVLLSSSAARDLNVRAGDRLKVQIGADIEELEVTGVLPPAALADRAGVIDIAAAQWKFEQLGMLSRINVRLAPGADTRGVREAIATMLPAGVRITTPGEATDEALRLSRAYRSNLTALALVALFTGGFFVYSTQSLATLRRRRELAILHALGVTRAEQWLLLLIASALIGLLGALLGVALGIGAAAFGLRALGADLGAGYFRGVVGQLQVSPAEIAIFLLLGVIVAVIGALRPAFDAARVPTASALKSGDVTSAELRTHGTIAATLIALAALVLMLPPVARLPLPGYVSIALLLIGVVVAMPSFVKFVLRRAPRLRAPVQEIAVAQIAGAARYATVSVSAIIVSFSLMVSMAIMVTSFRTSLDLWMQKLLPADVYLRAGYVGHSSHLSEDTLHQIERLPGIERVESSRFARVQLSADGPPATLIARTIDPQRIGESLWIMHHADGASPPGSTDVWLNEAASDLFGLQAGDTLDVPLAGGSMRAFVRGIWRDYEHQNGALLMDRHAYTGLTGDRAINTISMWLDDDASLSAVQSAVRDLLPAGMEYDLRTPVELRKLSLAAFDRTFAVTYLLEMVAILIGLFGIAAGISAQVLARRGEFGALRHLGFTRAQIGSMLALEGGMLGALGVVLGLLAGGVISLILVYVVNRQSFHWSMDLAIPASLLGALSLALIAASALIAAASGRQAMSTDAVRAVKEDW